MAGTRWIEPAITASPAPVISSQARVGRLKKAHG